MRKIFTLFVAALCCASIFATEGALIGKFSVNEQGHQIVFSQGNLQYYADGNLYRFATNQYDTIGAANVSTDEKVMSDLIDLFCWGTGNNPMGTAKNGDDFSTFTDWGVNPIFNGGNKANLWRTITQAEIQYILEERTNAINLVGLGTVNGVHGIILLPDAWQLPQGLSFYSCSSYTEASENLYDANIYSELQWIQMEYAGAVFLPAAGYRYWKHDIPGLEHYQLQNVNELATYWTSTSTIEYEQLAGCSFGFGTWQTCASPYGTHWPNFGCSVRLIANIWPEGIDNTSVDTKSTKRIVDGQLFIEKNGKTYNAQGAEVK